MNDLAHGFTPPKRPPGMLLSRVALVRALSELKSKPIAEIARERFGDHEDTIAVVRSMTGTADTTTSGWASELVRQDLQAFLSSLTPTSAFAAIAARALIADLGQSGSASVPYDASATGTEVSGAWVGEGGGIPVKRGIIGASVLNRYKMAAIVLVSEELARATGGSAEAFMRRLLSVHTSRALDGFFFSAQSGAVGVRPAGIVHGIAPLAASTTGSAMDKAVADLGALVEAIATSASGERIVIALNTRQRLSLAVMRSGDQWLFRDELARGQLMGVEMVSSRNVPLGCVFALDADNLATALGDPEIEANREAALVLADADSTAPTHATSASDRTAVGSPEQVPPKGGLAVFDAAQGALGKAGAGAVSLSTFQSWVVALRLVLPLSWTSLRPGSAQWVAGVGW